MSGEYNDDIDWDTEDELEIQEIQETVFSSCSDLRPTGQHAVCCDGEASSSSVPFRSKFIQQFVVMGFTEESIAKAIEQNGENSESVLDSLLTFKALDDSPEEQPSTSPPLEPSISSDDSASEYNENVLDDVYEEDSWSSDSDNYIKRKVYHELCERKKQRDIPGEETIQLPKPMIGFGVPIQSVPTMVQRILPEKTIGRPFFYYENVALAPKGVWDTIKRHLYEIEPEFVDSKYFSATARKRGYLHNLPIENSFPLFPLPPRTIHEALPLSKRWWPSWDGRTKLNCLQTAIGSARLTDRIRKAVEKFDGDPPMATQKEVLYHCKKWNLVWVGRNKVAPLEPDEVDTVAYHLSVLRDLFPNGMNVLSLFSGIGGAEVALYRLGIPLNNVISVEKSEVNRNILRSWWEQTNQRGNLLPFDDVQLLSRDRLLKLIESIGGFDLVIGGSPCNNLAGSNRVSRDGLEGKESSLFFDYVRILNDVKSIMSRHR
ncbi:unnamed protein product [Withania somnifera]